MILKLLRERGSITVTEVKDLLDASESTVRRDITALDQAGKLTKVFGGAVALEQKVSAHEDTVAQKKELHQEEKRRIARYAAALIGPEDFVFLDAGTTTGHMIDYIGESQATYVTNGVSHAQKLVSRGMKVLLIGGELKASTEAVVGSQAVRTLRDYHFTKGFFGVNGITRKNGCTTPDDNEAILKRTAMEHCKEAYVLCDSSKFDRITPITFAGFYESRILTERKPKGYEGCENVTVVECEEPLQ